MVKIVYRAKSDWEKLQQDKVYHKVSYFISITTCIPICNQSDTTQKSRNTIRSFTYMQMHNGLWKNCSILPTAFLQDAKTGKLRLLSCARTLIDEAIDKVKAKGYITPNGDEPTEIFTCGIGCSKFGPKINKELNVK